MTGHNGWCCGEGLCVKHRIVTQLEVKADARTGDVV